MDDATKMLLEQLDKQDTGSQEGWSDVSRQGRESLTGARDSETRLTAEESLRLEKQLEALEKKIGEVEGMVLRHLNTPDNIAHKW